MEAKDINKILENLINKNYHYPSIESVYEDLKHVATEYDKLYTENRINSKALEVACSSLCEKTECQDFNMMKSICINKAKRELAEGK